ncbi:hypothetical protein ACFPFX_20935 [Streptomyces mauvecolor]|uniref:Streptomyces killer toxin-like beta/gamma crystallin domain-containing protein n=1 Tax=Streptomyces mauvecolor TaxID=58345 RepID=A0ABV9UT27_9ACTN
MPILGKPKRAMMKKAAQLTAGVVASCGLMLAAPTAAHANSGPASQVIRPNATTPHCGLAVEVHFSNGNHTCVTTNGMHYVSYNSVDWVQTGNQWVALVYNGDSYQPGMPPGSTWSKGSSISRIDVNT